MVDKKNRTKAAQVIRDFLACRITNDEFDEQYPHDSYDPALRNIERYLWLFWSDLETHKLEHEHQLDEPQRAIFERCIAFLETELEYEGPPVRIELFAWLKRGLRSIFTWLRQRPHADKLNTPWWPFVSEEQYLQHGHKAAF